MGFQSASSIKNIIDASPQTDKYWLLVTGFWLNKENQL